MSLSERIRAVADRQAILDQMTRYCQSIDRCDLELLKSTFHHDGVVRFGIFDGNAWEFCEYDIPFIKENLVMAWHRYATVDIELISETRALAESYMLGNASARTPDGVLINCPDGMRYLDVWEKRDGVWRMYSRDLVMDWNAAWPYAGREDGHFAQFRLQGRRDRADLAYELKLVP
ncbi:nuclear transport factor 2 family protein [Pseudomonas jinjuensis]|uniref:SnoaL-like domain-containing protein n=1 Tax=Pseudomonas jinjuensis TaxID=198616 RepID=A0A1H0EJ77_9PSED|nr:nuclear transport factor 2 family protein [Pseudomonas jinjuensis]SDN82375.1 SnoaL-like domain-containing protein [Pseudomonas jinjuensis]